MTEITSCSLVSFDRVNRSYELHLLVQGWIQTMIPHPPEVALARSTFLLALSIDEKEGAQDYAYRRSLELHLNSIMQHRVRMQSGCAAGFSRVLFELGQYGLARTLQSQVMEATTRKLGREHLHTLLAMHKLAYTYYFQDLCEQAESLQVEVLAGRRRILGDKHIDTLDAIEDLGNTYTKQGLYQQAEVLHMQVLAERKQTIGIEHPKTLTAMTCLAYSYSCQGLYKQAAALQVQVLEERRRALSDKHPETLLAISFLAETYHKQGLYKQAEALLVEVLEGRKPVLGDKHPHTLLAMSHLARRREVSGLHHPATFAVMWCLAYTYKCLGSSRQDELNALKAEIGQLGTEQSVRLLQELES
ncbi:hypothetical protein FRC09_014597 [Ceratobasidium sp. 395]|nr:hypothetical protein FRC09_014597 [Ceratobasidium sp. 395]